MSDVHTSTHEIFSSDVAFTPAVKAIQARKGSRDGYAQVEQSGGWRTEIDEKLAGFLGETNSFYFATASADGQPYMQHRGGPKGFIKILDKNTIAFADFSGNRIELVVRPLNSGWRYFPSRDAGIRGLADVMMRSVDVDKDLSIWCGILGVQVSDWAGDAAYLRFDDAHHRIVLFPATRPGILSVEYAVEDIDLLMRNYYVLRDLQVAVVHGPGRRPASEQLFLTFAGPSEVLFGFVAEGAVVAAEGRRPRQFPAGPAGLCSWGSECKIGEFNEASSGRSRQPATI